MNLRLGLARTLAWAVLLGGWIGVAALADRFSAGPVEASGIVAAWLLATGAMSAVLGRLRWPIAAVRVALPAAAVLASFGLWGVQQGGGTAAVLAFALGWAALLALASQRVRALRLAAAGAARLPSPVASAALGALLAWAVVGDPSDLLALADRLAVLAGVGALLLAALQPAHGAASAKPSRPGCRAGLFDCALPAWPAGAWRDPAQWPMQLAAAVMLPMMLGLPQMLARCRSDMLSAPAVLGLHLAAMFLPALIVRGWARAVSHAAVRERGHRWPGPLVGPWRGGQGGLPASCAGLLVLGAAAAAAGGPWAAWGIALAHGAAWSLAWSLRLGPGRPVAMVRRPASAGSPLAAGVQSAALVILLGALQAWVGGSALQGVHGVLGLLAAVALASSGLRRAARARVATRGAA